MTTKPIRDERLVTDTHETGQSYPKLEAYMISKEPSCLGASIYMGSSLQFARADRYKQYLNRIYGDHHEFCVLAGDYATE